ncbi:MAG: hypothetical protein NUW02_03455 [Candidatus Campbellbacteria bacterium]|nr:hypothetical protein [Candidatus Campbellbacteria bacterium]
MKKISKFFIILGLSLVPLFASVQAAFNDVTFETTAILDVGGYELTIYGSSAEIASITISATDFSITLDNGSAIIIASADKVGFTHDADAQYVTSEVCSDTESRLGLASVGGNPTITITPEGVCVASESGVISGGGSSGRRIQHTTEETNQDLVLILMERLIELLKQYLQLLLTVRVQ